MWFKPHAGSSEHCLPTRATYCVGDRYENGASSETEFVREYKMYVYASRWLPHVSIATLSCKRLDNKCPDPMHVTHIAGNVDPPILQELAPQTACLQQFLSIMGAAVRPTTSLDMTLTFQAHRNERQKSEADLHISEGSSVNSTSTPAALSALAQFASLLDNACPNVCRLGVGGGVGEEVMRLFGRRLHTNITTLEVLDSNFQGGQFGGMLRTLMLPHAVCLVMPRITRHRKSFFERIYQSLLNPCLTHLEVGKGWFEKEADWSLVTAQLRTLCCHSLPLYPGAATMRDAMQFPRLESVCVESIHSYGDLPLGVPAVGVEAFSEFLRAASALRSFSILQGTVNTLATWDRCCPFVISDLNRLSQKMLAEERLVLHGVKLICMEQDEFDPAMHMSMSLSMLPKFPTFEACDLRACTQGDTAPGCLSDLVRAMPHMKVLQLTGVWEAADVIDGEVFPSIRSMDLCYADCSEDAIVKLVTCMPGLTFLRLRCGMAEDACDSLRTRLHASQAVVDEVGQGLGDWLLQGTDREGETVWCRSE